jgi:hypothetical protein
MSAVRQNALPAAEEGPKPKIEEYQLAPFSIAKGSGIESADDAENTNRQKG